MPDYEIETYKAGWWNYVIRKDGLTRRGDGFFWFRWTALREARAKITEWETGESDLTRSQKSVEREIARTTRKETYSA